MLGREEKISAIDSGLVKQVSRAHANVYFRDDERARDKLVDELGIDKYMSILNLGRSIHRRRKKVSDTIVSYSKERLVFGTLTFNNEVLSSTDERHRRIRLVRFLKSRFPSGYIGNVDYGKKNGREHYHFIAISLDGVLPLNEWRSGYSDIRIVGNDEDERAKIAQYLTKLERHALKATASRLDEKGRFKRIIYSRNRSS